MITIAKKFNGRLRGDDGEFYDESYFTNGGVPSEDDKPHKTIDQFKAPSDKRAWWKIW